MEILVIILSVFLAIFLIIGIAVFVEVLKLLRRLNDLSERANEFVEDLGDNLMRTFKKSITPSVIASGLYQFVRRARKSK